MRKLVYTDMASRLREWLRVPENQKAFADTWNGIAKELREATKNCTCSACIEPVSESA